MKSAQGPHLPNNCPKGPNPSSLFQARNINRNRPELTSVAPEDHALLHLSVIDHLGPAKKTPPLRLMLWPFSFHFLIWALCYRLAYPLSLNEQSLDLSGNVHLEPVDPNCPNQYGDARFDPYPDATQPPAACRYRGLPVEMPGGRFSPQTTCLAQSWVNDIQRLDQDDFKRGETEFFHQSPTVAVQGLRQQTLL